MTPKHDCFNQLTALKTRFHHTHTCIIEERFYDGAVFEEGTNRADVLKVTALKGGVDESHGLKLHANKPEIKHRSGQLHQTFKYNENNIKISLYKYSTSKISNVISFTSQLLLLDSNGVK